MLNSKRIMHEHKTHCLLGIMHIKHKTHCLLGLIHIEHDAECDFENLKDLIFYY